MVPLFWDRESYYTHNCINRKDHHFSYWGKSLHALKGVQVWKNYSFVNTNWWWRFWKIVITAPIILCKVNWVRYQVSSKGLWQDHLLLQFLLNVFCWINHPLRAGKERVQRRTRRQDLNLAEIWTGRQSWTCYRYCSPTTERTFGTLKMFILMISQETETQNTSKTVFSDLVAEPGPVLLLNRQAFRIAR